MSQPASKPLPHDPGDQCRYSLNVATLLDVDDTLQSCTVTVESGTATVSASNSGGTSNANATILGTYATIWVLSAALGSVVLRWAIVTAQGVRRTVRTTLVVEVG